MRKLQGSSSRCRIAQHHPVVSAPNIGAESSQHGYRLRSSPKNSVQPISFKSNSPLRPIFFPSFEVSFQPPGQ